MSTTTKPVCADNHGDIPTGFLARHPGSLDKRTVHEQHADDLRGGGPRWEDIFGRPYPGPPGKEHR